MELRLALSLPRDARFVPLMRRTARTFLRDLQIPRAEMDDVILALSEVCANTVRHAAGVEEYTVTLTVDDQGCEVEIVDLGPGFDLAISEVTSPHPDAESGRGIRLMRTLVDDLRFVRDPLGMRVRLCKRWDVACAARSSSEVNRSEQRQPAVQPVAG